jgi:hypothetical protein
MNVFGGRKRTAANTRSRIEAEQFEFVFAPRPAAPVSGVFLTQLEFPLSIPRLRRAQRPNFSEFKQLVALLRCQKGNARR